MNKNDFKNEKNQIIWEDVLHYIWENESKGLTMKEWATEFGVHWVTLTNKWTGWRAAMDLLQGDDVHLASVLARQDLNNKKNAAKVNLQRREINKYARKEALTELILDSIQWETIKPYKPIKHTKKKQTKDSTQIYFVTDLHYKNKELSKGLYDIGKMIVDSWDGSKNIKIVFGGDYIEGRKHRDQQLSTASESEQSMAVAAIISEIISYVIANTNTNVKAGYLIGNHDEERSGGDKAQENLKSHFVNIIQKTVRHLLQNYKEYSEIGEPCYQLVEKLGDKKINFRHGHIGHWTDKSIQSNVLKEELQLNRSFDMYVFGHFHRWNDWQPKGVNKRFIIAPAMKTYDGNFENARLLRNTTGIVSITEDSKVTFIPWKGDKLKDGELD